MLIAPSAPTILRRTVALSANAGRIERHLACRRAFFDDDYMFPVVAEVVGVDEAGDAGFQQAVQGQPIFIGDVVGSVAIAVLPATDIEGMEMVIMPTHRGLDRLMQVSQRHLAKHEEAAPDRRSRAAQRHFRLTMLLPPLLFGSTVLAMIPHPLARTLRHLRLLRDGLPDGKRAMERPAAAARRGSGGWPEGSGCRVVERSRRRT